MKIRSYLDLGCGDGSITREVAYQYGLEPHQVHCVESGRHGPSDDMTWHMAQNGGKLPFPTGHFDLVTAFMSLHHIEWTKKTISEIARVLRPNGMLIIREHDVGAGRDPVIYLDWVHVLYAICNERMSIKRALGMPRAQYRSAEDWRSLLGEAGLVSTESRADPAGRVELFSYYEAFLRII